MARSAVAVLEAAASSELESSGLVLARGRLRLPAAAVVPHRGCSGSAVPASALAVARDLGLVGGGALGLARAPAAAGVRCGDPQTKLRDFVAAFQKLRDKGARKPFPLGRAWY